MSQFTHPTIPLSSQLRSHRVAGLAALLALLATTAVVLVLAIDGGSATDGSVAGPSQPALRSDGGPDESAVAASVGSRPSAGPSESRIAPSVGGAARPDESTVAGALSQSSQPRHAGPDEAATAAAISGR